MEIFKDSETGVGVLNLIKIRLISLSEPFCLAKSTSAFHSVMFHPIEPRLVITANSKEGVASWDVRMPKRYVNCLNKYTSVAGIQNFVFFQTIHEVWNSKFYPMLHEC